MCLTHKMSSGIYLSQVTLTPKGVTFKWGLTVSPGGGGEEGFDGWHLCWPNKLLWDISFFFISLKYLGTVKLILQLHKFLRIGGVLFIYFSREHKLSKRTLFVPLS